MHQKIAAFRGADEATGYRPPVFGRLVTSSPASLSVDNVLPSGRGDRALEGAAPLPSRLCISRPTNPVVLRRRFLLQLGQRRADIPTPGDLRARYLRQRRLAIILREAALCIRRRTFLTSQNYAKV